MIEVKTKFDPKIAGYPVMKFQLRKLRPFFIIFSLFLILIGAMAIANFDINRSASIRMLSMSILTIPFILVLICISQKIANNSMKLLNTNTQNCFRFEEDKFYQETVKGDEYRATSESVYGLLYKVYENRTHFYLMISNMQSHVFPKSDIVIGTAEELSDLLMRKLGKKFKSYIR